MKKTNIYYIGDIRIHEDKRDFIDHHLSKYCVVGYFFDGHISLFESYQKYYNF